MKIQLKLSEILILLSASLMSFLANLPDSLLGNLIDRQALLTGLAAMVVIAMFRYMEIFLLVVISILAIGANLPNELASALGLSQTTLIVFLGFVIAISLHRLFAMKAGGDIVDNGTTALHLATGMWHSYNGQECPSARFQFNNAEEKTPLKITPPRKKMTPAAEVFVKASKPCIAKLSQSETRHIDSEIWR